MIRVLLKIKNKMDWYDLPLAELSLDERIGAKVLRVDNETDFDLSGYSLCDLHDIAGDLERMDNEEIEIVKLLTDDNCSISDATDTVRRGNYQLVQDVHTDYSLGQYWIDNCLYIPETTKEIREYIYKLISYLDKEKFGRDIRIMEGGVYTKKGYLVSY